MTSLDDGVLDCGGDIFEHHLSCDVQFIIWSCHHVLAFNSSEYSCLKLQLFWEDVLYITPDYLERNWTVDGDGVVREPLDGFSGNNV